MIEWHRKILKMKLFIHLIKYYLIFKRNNFKKMLDSGNTFSNFQFHKKSFWNNFYKKINTNHNNINWYFDITKTKIKDFSLSNISKEHDEILLIGPGLSSILDYLDNNGYTKVTIFDYCEELKKIISEKYNKEWEIICEDIITIDSKYPNEFSKIFDKGCLDCILSDIINGEKNFIKALENLLICLTDDGILYYFSDGKLEDRINLFYKIPKLKYKLTIIDMNNIMKEEYKEFNSNDNIYYLYTITQSI